MEMPEEKSLREQVLEFFQQPVVSRKALEQLFQKSSTQMQRVLTSLVEEGALLRRMTGGKYFYTINKEGPEPGE